MKILAVNWLDKANPQAGGAEVHFFEIFRRIVDRGHSVTLVASGWDGAEPTAATDGIKVLRFARRYSFALKARAAVRQILRQEPFDVLVEDINKIPLFLPTLTSLPVYALVPHLFGQSIFQEAAFPVAVVVRLAELPIPRVYRRSVFHAISKSTRDDLVARGIPKSAIEVIYPGVDTSWYSTDDSIPREIDPTFLYVGRLRRYKGVNTAIGALAILRHKFRTAKLLVAGSGDDLPRLRIVARRSGVEENVEFLGFVSEAEKRDLMRRVWAVVLPSAREGWGMTNIEAAACGTPALAARSPGLTETVLDGKTGALFPYGDCQSLAGEMDKLCSDESLRMSLGSNASRFAGRFSWDTASELTEAQLKRFVQTHY